MTVDGWDVVVTCGGTGGHVLPALALVDALVEAGLDRNRIGFVGGRTGLETTLVPPTGTAFVGLPVRGLPRASGVRGWMSRVGALSAMARSVLRARALLARHHVRVVVGMGGYASLPCVLGAGRRRPVILYESNAVPGLAVRVAARRATSVACAFAGTAKAFPNGVHAGFLVRSDVARMSTEVRERSRMGACASFGIDPARAVLGIMGGSQGAARLNKAVLELCERGRDRADVAVVHLTGSAQYDDVVARSRAILDGAHIEYAPVAFEDDMARFYSACDLLVCRSGAGTCAELAATGTPSVCVPYPHATDDHQTRNAEELVRAGAAELLADDDLDGGSLEKVVGPLLADPHRLAKMASAAAGLGETNGAEVLALSVIGLLESVQLHTASQHRRSHG